MTRLNLGCGKDLRRGYVNVDFLDQGASSFDFMKVDLRNLPWPWLDSSVDEVMMFDFLEHIPYSSTVSILQECWRVLRPGASIVVQVPDLMHCARAANFSPPFLCNRCGWEWPSNDLRANFFMCEKCGQDWIDCALAATHRLYGGQDVEGNWHFNAFTKLLLRELLHQNGFENFEEVQLNENGETLYQNWNIRVTATKGDVWGGM